MSGAPGHAADGLVTIAVPRTIKPGCEAAYEIMPLLMLVFRRWLFSAR